MVQNYSVKSSKSTFKPEPKDTLKTNSGIMNIIRTYSEAMKCFHIFENKFFAKSQKSTFLLISLKNSKIYYNTDHNEPKHRKTLVSNKQSHTERLVL